MVTLEQFFYFIFLWLPYSICKDDRKYLGFSILDDDKTSLGYPDYMLVTHHVCYCFINEETINKHSWSCYHQIQLLADVNLSRTPQLVELVDDSKVGYHLLCCNM